MPQPPADPAGGDPRRKRPARIKQTQTHAPQTTVAIAPAPKLTDAQRLTLGNVVFKAIDAALDERQAYDANLVQWNNMYELLTGPKDWPWPNSSNVIIPIIPAHLDTLTSQISQLAITPHFYMVKGLTPDAMMKAHLVEQYLNEQFVKQRGDSTWYQIHRDWIHIALRDGVGIVECNWKRAPQEITVVVFVPEEDDNGFPVLDLESGRPKLKPQKQKIPSTDYDDVEINIVESRDFVLFPQESRSINSAAGVARKLYLYEDELRAMIRNADNPNGVLIEEEVDAIMPYAPLGTTELITDRQDPDTYTAGHQISLGQGQGPMTSEFFANRGPFLIWRVHTKQFDLDGDAVPEENIVYIHYNSMRCIGYARYPYWTSLRPYFAFQPFPRPNRFLGFSLVERLATISTEISAGHNQRRDMIDMHLGPPTWMRRGAMLNNQSFRWQPRAVWESDDPTNEFGVYTLPQIDISSVQNEEMLVGYAEKLDGIAGPSIGTAVGDRASATEVRAVQGGQNMRANEVAGRFRISATQLIRFAMLLKNQFPRDDAEGQSPDQVMQQDGQLEAMTSDILGLPYDVGVSGASDPTDSTARRQDQLALYQLLMTNPDIANDDVKRYRLERMLVESFGVGDPELIVGTEEQANQRAQAKAQAAQQAQQMAAMGVTPPGGAPGQNGQAPHPPQAAAPQPAHV